MNANEFMSALADKYGLKDGKDADFYKAHNTWCVTKNGAEAIERAEGITMKIDHCDVGSVFVAYRGTFTCEGRKTPELAGRTLQEIGSCRFNTGTKTFYRQTNANGKEQVTLPVVNNPESTHSPEMAWKRLKVRGTLAMVGASRWAYGADEMSSDWHRQGNGNGQPPPANQNQNQNQNQAAAAPMPPATNADGTPNHSQDPRIRDASQSNGWFPEAVKLPTEWNTLMACFSECTHQARSKWEGLIFDHVGKFHGAKGWWKPTTKYKSFNDAVFGVDTWNNTRKSKSQWALSKLHEARDILGILEDTGMVMLQVPDTFGIMKEYKMLKHGFDENGYPIGAAPDNVPKPENENQSAADFPHENDFGMMANDDVSF